MGGFTTASEYYTVAIGDTTTAAATRSVALGREVTVTAAGANSFAFGLGDATGVVPQVSGASSFGIFMGDQSGIDLTDANTVSFMGASGGFGIGSVSPATALDVSGTLRVADGGEACAAGIAGGIRYGSNSLYYCDGTTWQTLASTGSTVAAGSTGQIQYNSGGSMAANSSFFWDVAGSALAIGSSTVSGTLSVDVTGDVGAVNYCDADGNNCFTAASILSGGGGHWVAGTGDDIYYNSGTPQVGIGTTSPQSSFDVATTDALIVPRGTTGQRPGTGVNGMLRYNSSSAKFEGYQAGSWQDIISSAGVPAGAVCAAGDGGTPKDSPLGHRGACRNRLSHHPGVWA